MRRCTLQTSLVVFGFTAIALDALAQGAPPPAAPPPAAPPPAAPPPAAGQPPADQKPAAKPDDKKKADEKKPAGQPPANAPPSGGQPSGDQPSGAAPDQPAAAAPGDGTTSATAAPAPESQPPSPSIVSEPPTLPGTRAAATPGPGFTPATAPGTPPGVDTGEEPEEEKLPPPEMSIAPELFVGINGRLGGSDVFRNEDSAGMTFGLGAWFSPVRLWAVGLQYQRTGLGSGETPPGDNSISAHYDLNTIWLGGRAYPLRTDRVGLFVALQLGASWQDVSANGTRATGVFTTPAATFSCSGSDGPGFALGGGGGVDVDLDRHFAFIAQVEATGHQLTSDPVDGCVAGAGSATNLGAHVGFQYRFDLDQKPGAASVARTGHSVNQL